MPATLLFISHYGCGQPFAGNRARICNFLKAIRQLGWKIDFADVMMPDEELLATLPFVDNHVYRFGGIPYERSRLRRIASSLAKLRRRLLPKAVQSVDKWFLPHWDVEARRLQEKLRYKCVLVEYLFHSRFLTAFGPDCLKIIDTHDKFANRNSELEKRGATGRWFDTTEEGERLGLLRADRIIAIQEFEKDYFSRLLKGKRSVHTVGHLCEVTPLALPNDMTSIGIIASENPLNVDGLRWFLSEVWPSVVSALPAVRLRIGGRICNEHWGASNLEVLGQVDNIADFYANCAITINPMLAGTGLKIKTVEALAHGRVVLGTPTAFEGLAQCISVNNWQAIDSSEFSKLIIAFLGDSKKLREQTCAAVDTALQLNDLWLNALRQVFANFHGS